MSTNPFNQQAPIPGVKKIIVVGSGKGGVGKSTVAANLAMAIKNEGHKVGLLDADIYGPSVPRLFGAINQPLNFSSGEDGATSGGASAGANDRPQAQPKINPLVRYGLKIMSMGFIVNENQAVVWRGPMLVKAFEQFFRDVAWGELDYLVIDLPPGTGDVALTIAQKVPVAGAIVVSTPQNLAFMDAKKAIDMFKQIHVPLYGVIENMSYLVTPGSTPESNKKMALFPKGDIDQYLEANGINKIGELPFDPQIGLSTEAGMPNVVSAPDSEVALIFKTMAQQILAF